MAEEKTEKLKQQEAAYNDFIDYMVMLYREFGYLVDQSDEHSESSREESVR